MNQDQLIEILKKVKYPGTDKDIYSMGLFDTSSIVANQVNVGIILPHEKSPYKSDINFAIVAAIQKEYPALNVNVHYTSKGGKESSNGALPNSNIKNIIAVASGKGGVGKSTIATNLAISLKKSGAKVGLMDMDFYGPSLPIMLGLQGRRPEIRKVNDKDKIVPLEAFGVPVMSVGFLVDANKAMVMRGPRLAGIVNQFFKQVLWPPLDYLIVDLPPGTGDIQLSLVQTVSVTGAIIVTTPQRMAVADAIKAVNMFITAPVNVPLLGIVENMSWFTPEEYPNKKYHLFGKGGGQQLARLFKTKMLGQIPMVQAIMEGGDSGKPICLQSESTTTKSYDELAANVSEQVSIRNENNAPTEILEIKIH